VREQEGKEESDHHEEPSFGEERLDTGAPTASQSCVDPRNRQGCVAKVVWIWTDAMPKVLLYTRSLSLVLASAFTV
jgi:hypothetical protein